MSEYNVPQNRPNWILADLVLAPCIYLLLWVLVVKFGSFRIYEFLASHEVLSHKLKASATSGILSYSVLDMYVLWYKPILATLIGLIGTIASFNEKVAGPGRQLFIPWMTWTLNKLDQSRGMSKFNRHENPLFPPAINFDDPVVQGGIKDPAAKGGRGVFLGLRKRFKQDIEFDKRHKKRVEKLSDYAPMILSRDARFRHVLCTGGSGSGKTASIVGPMLRSDLISSKTSALCLNPKGDEYLLRVAADPVMLRRDSQPYKQLEKEFQQAVREGETRSFARWAMEVHDTSIKPFALISMSHPELSLLYDPLLHGDADLITKKLINSSDAINNNSFYKAQQESWLLALLSLILNDDDLKGGIGLKHLYVFCSNPDKRLGEALAPIVDVDAQVKFPHLAEKIQWQSEYERLRKAGETDEAERIDKNKLLSQDEKDKIQAHESSRNSLRILMSMRPENLAGLASHIQLLVEDKSISGIFVDSKRPAMDFREVLRNGGVIYLEVPTQSKAPQACAIARMVMMELQSYSADRDRGVETKNCDVFAYLDEFGSLIYDDFINVIDKCRSARIGLILAHQSLGNLQKRHLSDSFKSEILDNCGTKFVLQLQDVGTQTYFKDIIGEQEILSKSVSEGDSLSSGQRQGRTRGLNRGFQQTIEHVITESDLNCKRGFGFVRMLDEDQSSWRGAVSFNYLPENKLRSFTDVLEFLGEEQKQHPPRFRPFYDFAQDGQLWDPVTNQVVMAGQAFAHLVKKPAMEDIRSRKATPEAPVEFTDGPTEDFAAAPTQTTTNNVGDAAPTKSVRPNNPRNFLLGEDDQ